MACAPTTSKSVRDCAADGCAEPAAPGEYDYIVVGSGAGGGPVAARLAERGFRVLMVEAGDDVGTALRYQVPAMHARATETAGMAWWYFVSHHADATVDADDSKSTPEGILYPRGSALGGSTAVNAMVTVRAPRADWDRLATLTDDPIWRAEAMEPYHRRVDEWLAPELPAADLAEGDAFIVDMLTSAASVHVGEGPFDPFGDPTGQLRTAGELSRLRNQDINSALALGEAEGLYRLPLATRGGERRGTRERLLEVRDAGHPLTIWTRTFAQRVILEDGPTGPRAVGIEVVRGGAPYEASLVTQPAQSAPERVFATREVILAAGTFNTPQLLMLSGIGDPEALTALGIEARVASSRVGEGLQDRYEIAVVSELDEPLALLDGCALHTDGDDPCLDDWRRGTGVYETNGFLATVLRRSSPDRVQPNLQIFAAPGDIRGYYPGYALDTVEPHDRFSWLLLAAHTANRDGRVRLRSADPFERPTIAFDYFDDADPHQDPDLRALVEGVHFVRDVLARMRETHEGTAFREVWPGDEAEDDEALAAFIRRESWGHHACCTDAMGGAGAVLDSRLRVRGVAGLRVVDASVFPEIPGTFIAHPTFVMSERAADLITEAAR